MPSAPTLYATFDRVLCLNLSRRPDRWHALRTRLSATHWPFREVERFRAVDGKRVKGPSWFQGGNGAWGCFQSHLRLLEEALQEGTKSLLILEDDATFPTDFGLRIEAFFKELPDDWDGLLLGGQHLARPYQVSAGVVRVTNGNRTHAHALRGRYLQAAYQHLCDYPTHIRVPSHHVDHRFGALHAGGKYHVYAPAPWIVGQAEGASDISGKQEKERYWKEARPPRIEPPIQAASRRAASRPLVVVVGLYRSGCQLVGELLQELGIPLGMTLNPYGEDEELQELLGNFFSEPQLVELVPRSQREQRLGDWLARFNAAAPSSAPYLAAQHPLLALVGQELRSLVGNRLRVIHVERDFEEAVRALEQMPWARFKRRSRAAQSRLREHLEDFLGQVDSLRLDDASLERDPEAAAASLAAALQLPAPPEPAAR